MRCPWQPDGDDGLQSAPSVRSAAGQFAERYLHGQVLGAADDGERDLIFGLGGSQRLGQRLDVCCPVPAPWCGGDGDGVQDSARSADAGRNRAEGAGGSR
jgi:hypothetical protein